jgi:hypothetical protein
MDIIYHHIFILNNDSDTGFCLRPQAKSKPIQVRPTDITSPYIRITEPAQSRSHKQHTTETFMPLAWDLEWSHICDALKFLSELPHRFSVVFHLYSLHLFGSVARREGLLLSIGLH